MTHMTSAVWTSSNGSQCSKTFMRNSTITILTAKREWSAKSWKNPNTTETWPSNSNLDSSKLPLCIFTSFFSYYVFMFFKYASFWRVFFSKLCFNDFLNKQRYQLAHFQCRLFFYKYAKYLPFIFHEFLKFFFLFQKRYQLTVLLMSPFLSQIRQILGSFVSPRRYEGTPWWIPWCQQPCWGPKGLRGILPMPLLC